MRRHKFGRVALIDDLASETSGIRADINKIVGGAHDFFIVFNYNDRIAEIAEFFQHGDQAFGVTGMESD